MSKKKENVFTVTFYVEDGYVTGDRPLYFDVEADDIDPEDFESEGEMYNYFWEMVQEEFQNQVHVTSNDDNKFVDWLKQLKKPS